MEIRKVGVVGLGTMGAGIAQVCIQAGFETIGREVSGELGDRARATIEHYLARGVEKGRLTEEERAAALGRLTTTTELADLAGCDLVIEAIVEEPEAKQALFAELSSIAPQAILATNTSALSVTEIASAAAAPERVVGLHFFNPAPVMPLVEVVRAELTADEVYEDAYAFAASLGKEPVRCNDTPGFVANRVLIPLLNDCVRVLDEARVSPERPRSRAPLRRELADRPLRADRPDRHRRPRPRVRCALAGATRAADGGAAPSPRDGEGRAPRPQVGPRLLLVRVGRVCQVGVVPCAHGHVRDL